MSVVQDAENAAKRLDPNPVPPVDTVALATSLGLGVELVRMPTDVSAVLVVSANHPVIRVQAGDDAPRRRFSVAHALAHYLDDGRRPRACTRAHLGGLVESDSEVFANQFAAALIMPARNVAALHRGGADIATMAAAFGTSVHAVGLRLANLGLVAAQR